MKYLHGTLFGLVISAVMVTGLQTNCPRQCNCTVNFTVTCSGYSVVNITAEVPSDTLYYTYTALEINTNLGSVDFKHLGGLQTLTINTEFDSFVFSRRLNFQASHQAIFWPLANLTSLNISITWTMPDPMPEMFSYLSNLEVLNLSYTRALNYNNLQQSLKGLKNNHVLSKIILKNTQTFRGLPNGLKFDMSNFLEPIEHCPLQHLDLSYNSLNYIYPGLIRFAPNLTEIIVANNFLMPDFFSGFFLEILLHPSLEKADFSRQGYGIHSQQSYEINMPNIRSPTESSALDKLNELKALDLFQELPMPLRVHLKNANFSFTDVFNCITNLAENRDPCSIFKPECKDILETFHNSHIVFCLSLKIILSRSFGGIPCPYVPRIDELLKEGCGQCIVIPTMGNLRQLFYREGNTYDQIQLPPKMINKTRCLYPNKVEIMDFSNNYPLGNPDIDLVLQSPITGVYNNLREVKLSGCGLTRPYYNLSTTLKYVTSLDLSYNKLTLEKYDEEKYFIGPPMVRYFNLAGNAIKQDSRRHTTYNACS